MADQRIQRLARLLIGYSVPVKPGDNVSIDGTTLAAPLLRAMYRETLLAGGYPYPRISLPDQEEMFLKTASAKALATVSPINRLIVETFDCHFQVLSEENTRALAAVAPERQARRSETHRPLVETYLRRFQEGTLKWNVCLFPTPAYAQEAGMSLADYEDFVYGACLLDHDDPVAAWQAVRQKQQRLVDYLTGKREVHVVGRDIDLRFSIAGRTVVSDDGCENMPAGEVFTAPIEDSLEGAIRFSYPASHQGHAVEEVRLRFERGRVVEAASRTDEEFLRRMLDLDEGARVVGECAFGTNMGIERFTGNTLFDEKIGGTMHLALGASIPGTGGRNESALHWDMVTDLRSGSEVRVDGDLFIKDGAFAI